MPNAETTGEFCWNLATVDLADRMNASSAGRGREVDEFALAGLTPRASTVVEVPYVAEARVNFECRTCDVFPLRSAAGDEVGTWLTIGEVVGVHIDDTLLVDGIYQTASANPLLRAGGPADYYSIDPAGLVRMRRPE